MNSVVDCHAHTTMSDGELTVAELVEVARARGVRPGVADHLSCAVKFAVKDLDGVRAYLDELEAHDVARGGEFCWHDTLWREMPRELWERFTHRIGSLHAVYVPGLDEPVTMFGRDLPAGITPDVYMDAHLANLERLAREMPVDILAHPTLLPVPYRPLPIEQLWTEEREERAVRALRDADIAFEVSSRYRPHERFVRRAAEGGVRLAIGSDGHSAAQVANVEFSVELVTRLGVAREALFDPQRQ